jgi:predicted SAM-dependent methyltransferase
VITRLQLVASRLELLDFQVLEIFLDKSWIHFGDSKPVKERTGLYNIQRLRKHSFSYNINAIATRLLSIFKKKVATLELNITEIYNRTNFCDFYYQKGNLLPFEDNSINFIFSEHFFEHLFFDEALSLFKECYRILKPNGVIRTCVPDADLRTYLPPEPLGFPDIKLPFTDPNKHKTRWSIYSLGEAIKISGFDAIPIRYCDKEGIFIRGDPSAFKNDYLDCVEQELIFDLTYIQRLNNSLIVDGIKRVSKN